MTCFCVSLISIHSLGHPVGPFSLNTLGILLISSLLLSSPLLFRCWISWLGSSFLIISLWFSFFWSFCSIFSENFSNYIFQNFYFFFFANQTSISPSSQWLNRFYSISEEHKAVIFVTVCDVFFPPWSSIDKWSFWIKRLAPLVNLIDKSFWIKRLAP